MDYIKAFVFGGLLCLIGQILIDRTKLTPARILVSYVVAGVVLGAVAANVVHWGIASINGMVIAAVCYLIGHFTSKK